MIGVEERLRELAAARDSARAALTHRITEARDLAKPATLAKRAQAEITTRAHDLTTQAIEIATDNRGILVGTGVALLGWLFRGPLIGKAKVLSARIPRARCRQQAVVDDTTVS